MCRRLRDACVEAEQRTNKRADVPDRVSYTCN